MRSFVLPLTMILSFGAASLAMASPMMTDGVIKSINTKTHVITLVDGTSYVLPKGMKTKHLKVGEKVAVAWEAKGKTNEVSKISMLK